MSLRRSQRLGGRAPTIGVLVDGIAESYQAAVLHGAFAAAREREVNILCVAGGELDGAATTHGIYDWIGPSSVDGLILLSGTLGNKVGSAGLASFIERFQPLPICSVGMELTGASSVCTDDRTGMRAAVAHLITVHGRRRIAFIRGPAANRQAQHRYEIYQEVLTQHGLSFDERLVVRGSFEFEAGGAAVRELLEARRVELDALVASNDTMALGAMLEFAQRGVRVPEVVAVVGFDDLLDARHSEPPLTTVRQPLDEQGRQAVRIVHSRIHADYEALEQLILRSELVVRASCGCMSLTVNSTHTVPPPSRFGFEAAFVERREPILAALARASRGAFASAGSGWEIRLMTALSDDLLKGEGGFVETTLDLLDRMSQAGVDTSICHDVLTAFRRQLTPCLSTDLPKRARAEELLDQTRSRFSQGVERASARGERDPSAGRGRGARSASRYLQGKIKSWC